LIAIATNVAVAQGGQQFSNASPYMARHGLR